MNNDHHIQARCWCSAQTVGIPVGWLREGRTRSCGLRTCGPGCEMVDEPDPYDEPVFTPPNGRRRRMNKFNPDTYDPRSDSSPDLAHRPDALVLYVGEGLCPCGCAETPKSKRATFAMGHDIRLRGKLARALSARRVVVLVDADSYVEIEVDPLEYAARFSTKSMDWAQAVRSSADRVLARMAGSAAEREILTRAAATRGDERRLVQIGRWDFTGRVAAVYDNQGVTEYEYVDRAGRIQRAVQQPDGSIRPVDLQRIQATG